MTAYSVSFLCTRFDEAGSQNRLGELLIFMALRHFWQLYVVVGGKLAYNVFAFAVWAGIFCAVSKFCQISYALTCTRIAAFLIYVFIIQAT